MDDDGGGGTYTSDGRRAAEAAAAVATRYSQRNEIQLNSLTVSLTRNTGTVDFPRSSGSGGSELPWRLKRTIRFGSQAISSKRRRLCNSWRALFFHRPPSLCSVLLCSTGCRWLRHRLLLVTRSGHITQEKHKHRVSHPPQASRS